jgi:hypothetical protein
MPIARRLIAGIEFAVYGTLSRVSGWFPDDTGFGGRDPLADGAETRRDNLFSTQLAPSLPSSDLGA